MPKNLSPILIVLAIANGSTALAVPSAPCSKLSNPAEFYSCMLQKHPKAQSAEALRSAADASLDKASQFTNPELEVKNTNGNRAGETNAAMELTLNFPVSDYLFGRGARMKVGAADKVLLETEAKEQSFETKSQVISDLYRYRQITNELLFVDEVLGTFAKIEKQFKSRRSRGPEQEITLNLVILAQGDYELKKNHLSVEKQEVEARFKSALSDDFKVTKEILPEFKREWPQVSPATNLENNFSLQKSIAARDRAYGEKSIANVESWPKIVAGPIAERTVEGIAGFNSYGFSLTVDLPIFSFNGGGRGYAEAQKIRSEIEYELANNKARLDSNLVYQKYVSAVESLKKSERREDLAKKHLEIDRLFNQGLTSGATIIEAHRQIWEFMDSQHEHERTALSSLLQLYQLQGKDPGEALK